MMDIEKHIAHWLTGADEDFEVASQLIRLKKTHHGLFFLHLTLEKIMKAHVCRHTQDIAPRIHNLARLVELTGIVFKAEQDDHLSEMNPCNIEGRYPELWGTLPSVCETQKLLQRTEDLFTWLKNQLNSR